MPTYQFDCPTCGASEERIMRIAEYEDESQRPQCCGATMRTRIFAPAVVSVQSEARYACPVTGEVVTTNRKRRYLMDKHNLADANDFPASQTIERKDKFWAEIRADARQANESLPKFDRDAVLKAAGAQEKTIRVAAR